MFDWLRQNIGTIAVLIVLVAIVTFIIVCRIKAKKRGESSCGCKCSDCSSCGMCHQKNKTDINSK